MNQGLFVRLSLAGLAFSTMGCPSRPGGEKAALPPEGSAAASDTQNAPAEAPASTESKPQEAVPEGVGAAPPAAPATSAEAVATPAGAPSPAGGQELRPRISGTVQAARQGSVSFKVGGHIERILVETGTRVKKGQALAQLDERDYALREKIASNGVEQARINIEQARRDLQREEQLRRENATSQAAFERVSNALAAAQIALTQAQLTHQQAQQALKDTRLVAAFEGIISRRLKVEGEHVAVGMPVFEIYSTGDVEVLLRVPASLLTRVRTGQTYPLSIPATGSQTQLVVTRVVPVVQEASRTFEVVGRLAQPDERILPGQFVEAQL